MSDPQPKRLHLGCGYDIRPDWVNVDHPKLAALHPEIVAADFDSPAVHLPFDDASFEVLEASHVIEHITHILPFMQECWRVTRPGGYFYIETPFGSSDDAWEDPTHVRRMFPGSFAYFSQPTYWRSDYGYRGDWRPKAVILIVDQLRYPLGEKQHPQVVADIMEKRNVVAAMKAVLECVKPARNWWDPAGMDGFETRVMFADMTGNDPAAAREARANANGVAE